MEAIGVRNILSKSLGSNTPHNVVRAVFKAIDQLESPEQYAARVGKDLSEVLSNYTVNYKSEA